MRLCFRCAAIIAAAACFPVPVRAQQPATQPATSDDRLQRVEERLNQLDQHYQQELQKRDDEIAALRAQLRESLQRPASTRPSEADLDRAQGMQQITQDILNDIETRKKDQPLNRLAAIANPDLAVVADFLGVASTKNIDSTRNRFDIREVELDLRASVDPRADGVLVLSFARDAFPALFGASDVEGVDTSASVEEAYLFFHDFGIPNLTARVGRYHVRFGRQNVLHSHDLPTSDTPFVLQSFLAPEALVDSGFEFSYLIPNPWNEYFEFLCELNSGEGNGSESPTLRGDSRAQSPSIVTHLLWNKNLSNTVNLELGVSSLWGPSENNTENRVGGRRDVWLFGTDLTLVHRDPTGGFFNQFLQAEAIYGHTRQANDEMASSWGAYVVGQQQLAKDWYTGVRFDFTEDANDPNRKIWGVSPYLTWYWSEFLRFRASYEYRDVWGGMPADNGMESLFFFQITWIYGAHPPHPYWAMK